MKYLRILRPINLLIVLFTLFLFQYVIFVDAIQHLYNINFFLICLSAILITGSGNIVNDIFDVEIDQFNQEKNKLIPQHLSIASAWKLYYFNLVIGFVVSLLVAIRLNKTPWIVLYPLSCLILYYYSGIFKKRFAVGNFVISLFCALLPWILWIAFIDLLPNDFDPSLKELNRQLLLCYSALIFFTTFYREIIKDIEDIEGDRKFGASTLPIVLGSDMAKWIALTMLCLVPIAVIIYLFAIGNHRVLLDGIYFLIFILAPVIFLIIKTIKAFEKKDFHNLSQQAKLFMFSGILFLIFHFIT